MKQRTALHINAVRKDKQLHGYQNEVAMRVKVMPMRTIRVFGLCVGAFLMATLPIAAQGRERGGRVVVPMIRSWGWYGPFGYYNAYGPYGAYGFYRPYTVYNLNAGEVKLETNVKNAEVFINGAYAGTAGKLKTIRLRADAYNLELRAPGYASYVQKVFVIAGKTLRVHADLLPGTRP
jgi:hypothetical protein